MSPKGLGEKVSRGVSGTSFKGISKLVCPILLRNYVKPKLRPSSSIPPILVSKNFGSGYRVEVVDDPHWNPVNE